ncbi:hypothetical protein FKM82_028123 [Ascaphus truei]
MGTGGGAEVRPQQSWERLQAATRQGGEICHAAGDRRTSSRARDAPERCTKRAGGGTRFCAAARRAADALCNESGGARMGRNSSRGGSSR